jgi:hypothetical protein
MPLSSRKEVTRFVQRKLLFRLRRLAIIFLVIFGILVYEITLHHLFILIAAGGFIFGIAIGLLVARRMHHISWDADTNKAITRMDRIGIFILVGYILFSISRHWIFSHWFQGTALTVFTLSIASGAMLGRFWDTRQKIRRILKEEGILK